MTAAPAVPATARTQPDVVRALLRFTVLVMLSTVLLQRFGLPAGARSINIVGPIGLAAAAIAVLRGYLSFSRARLLMFGALCLCAAGGLLFHVTHVNAFTADPSLQSLLQFLFMTFFATLTFAQPVPEARFFRAVNACLAISAIAGLLQFVAQFVGLSLFSFRGIVPKAFLFEDGYNQFIALGFGDLHKSNGFFMDEPSIFSQFMAMALIIEVLTARRARHLALFGVALLSSASGTGWIILGSFVMTAAFSMGVRGIALAAGTAILGGGLLLGLVTLSPELGSSLTSRLDEVSRQSTSAHLRFITPFWVYDDALAREPAASVVGLGAGVSERIAMPYEYAMNTPVKIALEFGVPALFVYLGTLALGSKTAVQRTLTIPGMVMLLFAGGYQQFPPVLFPLLLIFSVARLTPPPVRRA